ncbi:ABC transporter permease subunit [Streptomyces alkaliterrae]|uniref:ABC transporter permease subunit n=1 Tax=Streptomyces alkaliterrae TaxID=2213162 RepID=A0A5P0YRR3_9ACTN|nr:ABC transporter permease subunit [Streptomyces alkaliterrae]MBB1253411.1 ABC transporter permease subunit [Streptomyces alkaliterrae]MBB1260004.1 ABC transporter permease subunit [Streptomyces alkaliterrae]MQS02132.1 ABC transporter permease subunit [Streptomyces alkaliterrae]
MSAETTPTTARAAEAPAGASIHDIGYRHYDGERHGRAYVRRSLFAQSLRGAFGIGRSAKSKVLPILLLTFISVPAVIVVAIAVFTDANSLAVKYTNLVINAMPLIGLFVAAVAPQLVSRDLRFNTMPLYLSRPMERTDYVAAKFAAMATAIAVFTGLPLLVMFLGGLLGKLKFADQAKGFAFGLVLVAVFSLLHAGISLLVASVTPRRGFGVGAIIAVLTIPYFAVNALMGILWYNDRLGAVEWLGLFSPGTLMAGIQSKYLDGTSDFPGEIVVSDGAGVVYLLVTALLIAGSYALLNLRYRRAGL